MMHWIQKEILKRLSTAKELRYIELKPENVDGNLFMYHLKQLIADGIIEKSAKTYLLTKEGKRYVGRLSLATGKVTLVPKVITMVYGKNNKGGYLLFKWSRQPYFGHISLPFNRMRQGESVQDTAKETVQYKTNLSGKTVHKGDIYIIVKDKGKVTTHYLAHIFALEDISGEPYADGLTGKPFWGRLSDFKDSDFVHGTKEIIKTIETKKSPFFEEIIVTKR